MRNDNNQTVSPYGEKLNIASVIEEIGPNRQIRLVFDDKGGFMISSGKMDYYPSQQGVLQSWKFETHLTIENTKLSGNWSVRYAEDMIYEIEKQMNEGFRLELIENSINSRTSDLKRRL